MIKILKISIGVVIAILLIFLVLGQFVVERIIYNPPNRYAAPIYDWIAEVHLTAGKNDIIAWEAEAVGHCPTVIFLHGNAGHLDIFGQRYTRLHEKGVGFIIPAWPGYSGSTGSPNEKDIHLTAQAAYDYVIAQGIPANQIVIHGNSLGSGAATKLAAKNDAKVLILEAPYYSMRSLINEKLGNLPMGYFIRSTFRTDQWITKVDEPVLIAHGSIDEVISQQNGKRLFERVKTEKLFADMQGSNHSTLVRDGLYEEYVWDFLDQHLDDENAISRCKK